MRNGILPTAALLASLLALPHAHAQVTAPGGPTPLAGAALSGGSPGLVTDDGGVTTFITTAHKLTAIGAAGPIGSNGSNASALQPGVVNGCVGGTLTLNFSGSGSSTGYDITGLTGPCAITIAGGYAPYWQYMGIEVDQGATAYPVTLTNVNCSAGTATGCVKWTGGTPAAFSVVASSSSVITFMTNTASATILGGI